MFKRSSQKSQKDPSHEVIGNCPTLQTPQGICLHDPDSGGELCHPPAFITVTQHRMSPPQVKPSRVSLGSPILASENSVSSSMAAC